MTDEGIIRKPTLQRVWWKGTYARFRWTFKRFGWHQVSIVTPIVWRWSLHCSLHLAPSGPWLLGVSFGRDDTDGDAFMRVGLLLVEAYVQAAECMGYDDYDRLYRGEG